MSDAVLAKTLDWNPDATNVSWDEVLAALERLRRENAHGFGCLEGERPWVNAPFICPVTGRQLGAGAGALVPLTLAWDGGKKTIGSGDVGPRRTSAPLAVFSALALALAGDARDAGGAAAPSPLGRRLSREDLACFLAADDASPEGAVGALVGCNLGVRVATELVRRGDLLQIAWRDGGKTPAWCWDVHHDGRDLWVQVLSAHASTGGIGVLMGPEALAATGTLEPVLRHGQVTRQYVHRADRDKPWLTTRAARDFYRAHGLWLRVPAAPGHPVGIETLHVGRLHGGFPRYPIALGGSHAVSSDLPPADGQPRTRARTTALYHANNEGTREAPRKGGFFPIGASRTWHGGVHLYPDKDASVVAPADGVLVAARLATDENRSRFGDAGFVLVKTRLALDGKERAFFTLLAHLAPWTPDEPEPEWFARFAALPPESDPLWTMGLDPKKTWCRVLPVPADPGDRRGADSADGGLHVYEKRDRGLSPGAKAIPAGAIVEAVERLSPHGWAKVRTRDGLEGFVYGLGRLARVDLTALDPALRKTRAALARGEVVDLSALERPTVVRAGERVGWAGQVVGERGVHVEVFSDELIPVNGKTKLDVEDPDPDSFTDRGKFDEAFFEQLDAESDTAIRDFMLGPVRHEDDHASADDVRAFFAGSLLRERLRALVTRHVSAWSDAIDWKKLDAGFPHVAPAAKQSFRDEVAKLAFWKKGFLAKAGLPQGQVVHHYHPVTFLAWLDSVREKDEGELHASLVELNR